MGSSRIASALSLLSLFAVGHLAGAATASAQLGDLPDGARRVADVAGVRGELYFTVFTPPELILDRIPAEHALITARDLAAADPALDEFLRTNARHGDWVLTAFTVSAFDSLTEGAGGAARPDVFVSWQAPVAFSGGLPAPLPAGVPVVYDLASWTDSSGDSVDVSLVEEGSGTWLLHLRTPGLRMSGSCDPHGGVTPASYEPPGYVVALGSGTRGQDLTVVTFRGHRGQACRGSWTVSGAHPLASALGVRPTVPGAWAQDMILRGWRARMAVYESAALLEPGG